MNIKQINALKDLKEASEKIKAEQFTLEREKKRENFLNDFCMLKRCTVQEGIEALFVSENSLEEFETLHMRRSQGAFGEVYDRLWRLADNHGLVLQGNHSLLSPIEFLQFTKNVGFNVPIGLEETAKKYAPGFVDWQSKYESIEQELRELKQKFEVYQDDAQPLNSKERNTLLKLISGLVKVNYKCNNPNERSKLSATIQNDLDSVELKMDIKTIREKLKQADETI
jgi:hypothetical protein